MMYYKKTTYFIKIVFGFIVMLGLSTFSVQRSMKTLSENQKNMESLRNLIEQAQSSEEQPVIDPQALENYAQYQGQQPQEQPQVYEQPQEQPPIQEQPQEQDPNSNQDMNQNFENVQNMPVVNPE